ncbi:MAG: glycerate kinase [Lachnospiraceae bacterium]|nr:glycerate kinase [Lachnospiraceae bacterium]
MIKAVIFDMFETLVTLYRSPQYFGKDMAKDLGLTEERFRVIWDKSERERSLGILSHEDVIARIMEQNGIYSAELLQKITARRSRAKVEAFMHLHEEIIPMLEELKRRDVKIGLISNCFSEETFAIRGSKLYPYFDACMLSYEQGVMKPDKEIFYRCVKKLNVSAEECLYVGDGGSRELETATEIGMKALQATWYFEDNESGGFTRNPRFPALDRPLEIFQYLTFFSVLFGTREPLHFRETGRDGAALDLRIRIRGSVGVYGFDAERYFGKEDISQAVREQLPGVIQKGFDHWTEEKSVMQSDLKAVLYPMIEKGLADVGIKVKTENVVCQLTEDSQEQYNNAPGVLASQQESGGIRLLFASDSFKGSLTSMETAELLTKAAKEVFENAECTGIPVADGGEGTVDALLSATGGEKIYVNVHGPLMENVKACYGKIDDKKAVIEMAAASGLTLIPQEKRDPMRTTTYGTGELLRNALEKGFEEIYVCIGGSATNDGGMGCGKALGIRFLDQDGKELEGTGKDLEKVRTIDASGLDSRWKKVKLTIACDVTNPLCGENGATRTFAPQKGADAQTVEFLEKGMQNYRDVIKRQFGKDPDQISGAGAAGGLGAMLMILLGGTMRSGIETVLDLNNFDRLLQNTDFVITGEGRTDWQSAGGKVLWGVGERAKKAGVPVIALSGSLGPGYEKVYEHGITSIMTTVDGPMSLEEAMSRAKELYYQAAIRTFRLIKAGIQ